MLNYSTFGVFFMDEFQTHPYQHCINIIIIGTPTLVLVVHHLRVYSNNRLTVQRLNPGNGCTGATPLRSDRCLAK